MVFQSTSGECGKPFDVKVMIWFKYTFFLASLLNFFPIVIVPLIAGMEGAATFSRGSILDISVRMWYLN